MYGGVLEQFDEGDSAPQRMLNFDFRKLRNSRFSRTAAKICIACVQTEDRGKRRTMSLAALKAELDKKRKANTPSDATGNKYIRRGEVEKLQTPKQEVKV